MKRQKRKKAPHRSLVIIAASLIAVMLVTAYFIATRPTSVATKMATTVYECVQCGRRNVFNNPTHFVPSQTEKHSRNFVPTITHIGHGRYIPVIETKRLRLREISMEDAPTLYSYLSKVENVQSSTYDRHESLQDAEKEIRKMMGEYRKGGTTHWAIDLKAANKMIGMGGFVQLSPTHHRGTVGWFFDEQYWGKGYATELARALIEYGMKYLRVNRLDAVVRVDNIASQRVMQKAGMSWSATFRDYWRLKNELSAFHQFVILKKDIADTLDKSTVV